MLEPVRVGDGVQIPPPEFLPKVREICDRYGVLLILDEVVTGSDGPGDGSHRSTGASCPTS